MPKTPVGAWATRERCPAKRHTTALALNAQGPDAIKLLHTSPDVGAAVVEGNPGSDPGGLFLALREVVQATPQLSR